MAKAVKSYSMPAVDVLLVSYNHADYIAQALESIKAQHYDGPLRIIVADDTSTDHTLNVVQAFAAANPALNFVFLEPSGNLGITRNYERGFKVCTAEFIAVLEGDDYWVSPHKLTKQVAFLQEHLECVACSSNLYLRFEEDRRYRTRIAETAGFTMLDGHALIADNVVSNFSTCVYRTEALRQLPEALFSLTSYDWIVNISLTLQGLIGYLHEPLSVYRLHAKGTWTGEDQARKIEQQIALIPAYDNLTGQVFSESFARLKRQLNLQLIATSSVSGSVNLRKLKRLAEALLPPFIIWLIRGLTPPVLYNLVRRKG